MGTFQGKSRTTRGSSAVMGGDAEGEPLTRRSVEQAVRLKWLRMARPEQIEPPGEWFIWLIRAGRGWGKTMTGAEWSVEHCRKLGPRARFHLVGQTFADMRDTMVEGVTGILSVMPPSLLKGGSVDRSWNRSLGQMTLATGAKIHGFSSEKPRQLRGPQCTSAWGDEPSTWADADVGTKEDTTFSNLLFGCRLPSEARPRIVLTGTPRPTLLMKQLAKDRRVVVTAGSTYENLANLDESFRENVVQPYEGTRLGRQELMGELLEDVVGALWSSRHIERWRVHPRVIREGWIDLGRTLVALDPSVKEKKTADDTGIIVVAAGPAPPGAPPAIKRLRHAYILDDRTDLYSPYEWAEEAVAARNDWLADRIVGETNNGGDLVRINVRAVDSDVPFQEVTASIGKRARAEEVVALYQQGRVHHVGHLGALEEEQTTWIPGEMLSPGRVDALVWGVWAAVLRPTLVGESYVPRDRRLAGRR